MIPQRLTLKNFLSYRSATLEFAGLHVACICGENGAGKSSLLEAIAWAVWGQSRASNDDDVIHLGELEAQVDFVFEHAGHLYRIIRSRQRNQSSYLEFQVRTPSGFRTLTARGIRATQQLIQQHLKLDYDTFVNSAYLRQGRADEFMLKRPSERKQILSDLLKLDQYDTLAEEAKERSRQSKAEIALIERNLDHIQHQIQDGEGLQAEKAQIEASLASLKDQQANDADIAKHLQTLHQQRQKWTQALQLQHHRQQELTQDCDRLQKEQQAAQQQLQHIEDCLKHAPTILHGYQNWQQLQTEDEVQSAKFQLHQATQAKLQTLEKEYQTFLRALGDRLRQAQIEYQSLTDQATDLQRTLAKTDDIAAALQQLRQAQDRLSELNQLQAKAVPLLQRRQQLQTQIDQAEARIIARIESLDATAQQLQTQHSRQPQLQHAIQDVATQIDYLEKRRAYQNDVREKGLERRSFMERLQADQRIYETQLAELDQKIRLLKHQGNVWNPDTTKPLVEQGASLSERYAAETESVYEVVTLTPQTQAQPAFAAYKEPSPLCPLCDRPLDEHHWQLVLARHQEKYNEVLRQLWVVREQLAVSEREIQVLRQEYRELEQELSSYGATLELRGRLQQQVHTLTDTESRLQQIQAERTELTQVLETKTYAAPLQDERRLLDQTLHDLAYDDRTHALARGDVDRWRWAEIRHAEITHAQRQLARLDEQRPTLEEAIAELETEIQQSQQSVLYQQIQSLQRQLADIAYDSEYHTQLRLTLKEAQVWQIRYQELLNAQQQHPLHQQRLQQIQTTLSERQHELAIVAQTIRQLTDQLQQTPDPSDRLSALETVMQERRAHLDQHLATLGRLQQQLQHIEALHTQKAEQQQQLQLARRQHRIYLELAQAFGKNGIQALMIENILPQLEAETNQLLGRLTAHQLHVQFVTQRARKGSSRTATKMIDTLDILISDIQGTRPYETYSGGEAFRVNFAIRLALARLLAQRSGTSLQMLIIDEGFGTQDNIGCSRLVGAIQAIASDFACILTVTHMPHLKEAFQTRIEVTKSQSGSHLQLVV
ncbi:MAG: AAA family ATPase [Synechococcales cyanobacterium T60_A2020_003]|nr:AAA family ATPase [Synechococcales cyanobacterium T60_A2020_003]